MNEKIRNQLKEAMKAKDSLRTNTLRAILAACTNELVSKGKKPDDKLTDEEIITVIRRGVKQRKDSIEQFEKGGRLDLAEKEKEELKILEQFLPALMPKEQIEKIAKDLQTKLGATDKAKSGQFMGALMKELKGQADGSVVKEVIDGLFK